MMILTMATMSRRLCQRTTLDILPGMRRPVRIPPIEVSPIPLLLVLVNDHLSIAAMNVDISHLLETLTRPTRRPSDRHSPNSSKTTNHHPKTMPCILLSV